MTNNWKAILEKFINMSSLEQITFLSGLLYIISMMARMTYEAGTNKVDQPELLRSYNELLHRISTQQLNVAKGKLDRMPDDYFFEMLAEEVTALSISEAVIKQLEKLNRL